MAWELPSTYPTPCCKEILIPSKYGYFPLDLCPKFWTWKISPRRVDGVVNKTRRRTSLCITPVRRWTRRGWTHIVYCTSVHYNASTPLLQFVLDLLYNLFLQLCSSNLVLVLHIIDHRQSVCIQENSSPVFAPQDITNYTQQGRHAAAMRTAASNSLAVPCTQGFGVAGLHVIRPLTIASP